MEWITTSWGAVGFVALSALAMYVGLIVLTRIAGLRSFSKMSSFDFAITVAIGSVLAGTVIAENPPLLQALAALAILYGLQIGLAFLRQRSETVQHVVDNEPLLLMARREILHDNLRTAKVTEGDLRAKLREANVLSLDHVHAVVLEATGDVSVLHGEPGADLDLSILDGVRDVERLNR